jgi:hypothetical protein
MGRQKCATTGTCQPDRLPWSYLRERLCSTLKGHENVACLHTGKNGNRSKFSSFAPPDRSDSDKRHIDLVGSQCGERVPDVELADEVNIYSRVIELAQNTLRPSGNIWVCRQPSRHLVVSPPGRFIARCRVLRSEEI